MTPNRGSHGKPHRTTKILSHAWRRGGCVAGRGAGGAGLPVVGFINLGVADASANRVAAFRKGLSEAGYAEDQNVIVESPSPRTAGARKCRCRWTRLRGSIRSEPKCACDGMA